MPPSPVDATLDIDLNRPTWRLAGPFVLVAGTGVAAAVLPPFGNRPEETALTVALFILSVGLLHVAMGRAQRSWLEPVAAYAAFGFIAIARDASGGATSGLTAMVLLPILWLAITATRRELMVGAVLTTATLGLPMWLIGGDAYPADEWRRVAVWTAIALVIAPVVQGLVTRLRRESAAVREANSQMDSILRGARLTSIVSVGLDGVVRTFSAGAEQLLGYTADEAVGQRVTRFFDIGELTAAAEEMGIEAGDETPDGLVVLAELARSDAPGRTWTYVRKDGERRYVRLVVTELRDADGAVTGFLGVGIDATLEVRTQQALLRANERSERLFEDAPHGVALLDTAGCIKRVNAALRAILAAEPGQLEGRSLTSLAPLGQAEIENHLGRLLADGEAHVSTDCTLRDLGGRDLAVSLNSTVLHTEPGPGSSEVDEDLVLVTAVDMSERRRYEERLAHLADHDVLTGLANRRLFDVELARHLERCKRYGPDGAVLLLDLDNFKRVNDTLGHGAGDELLITIAGLLRRELRATDVVARLGGDEFAILLTMGTQETAEIVANSVIQRIREHASTLDGVQRRVTASVGVVTFLAASRRGMDILALADMTMYDAKDAGRNQLAGLEEDRTRLPRSGARLEWQSQIEEAIDHDRFELLFQPIMDLHTDEVVSAEVLLRMKTEVELVPPSRFLYIAERVGLMPRVDAWVLSHSVEMLAKMRQLRPDFRLEVNLSGSSIGQEEIETAIVDSLRQHEVAPEALILEITETAAVADVELARHFAERMSRLGCSFALDDFGAGFGSFYYLKHLIFDFVKIDGEFVANSHKSAVDRTIMRSIVGIARDLGKQTIAEFVSEPEVLDVVRGQGVDLAQGYLIGKPIPYEEFEATFLLPASLAGLVPDSR